MRDAVLSLLQYGCRGQRLRSAKISMLDSTREAPIARSACHAYTDRTDGCRRWKMAPALQTAPDSHSGAVRLVTRQRNLRRWHAAVAALRGPNQDSRRRRPCAAGRADEAISRKPQGAVPSAATQSTRRDRQPRTAPACPRRPVWESSRVQGDDGTPSASQ